MADESRKNDKTKVKKISSRHRRVRSCLLTCLALFIIAWNPATFAEEFGSRSSSASSLKEPIPKPRTAEIVAVVKQTVFEHSNNVRIESVKDIRIAADRNGQWWVSATAVPGISADTDEVIIFMVKSGKKWKLIDLGTGVVPHTLPIPEEVRKKLLQ